MELQKAKNNTATIMIIIITLLILGGGAYYYYLISQNNNQSNKVKNKNVTSDLISLGINYFSSSPVESTVPETKYDKQKNNTITTTKTITKSIKQVKKPNLNPQLIFDKSFKNKKHNKAQLTAIQAYLLKSNKAKDDVKTFIPFDDIKDDKDKKAVKTGYKTLFKKSDATYPVDFRRTITVDRHISAILINDLNSSLAGQVIAQVERNVYATHGDYILIPVGSKIIGSYEPVAKIGDTRLDINWQRIITPRGINIKVGIETTDAMGRGGLAGNVDNRYSDRYGLSLLVSTINAAALLSIKTSQDQAVFINTFGKELTQVTGKILEDNINIKPIITIPHGTRILVRATKDIWFRDIEGKIKVEAFNLNNKKG